MTTRLVASLAAALAASAALADTNNTARAIANANFTPMSPPQDNIVQHPGLCVSSASATGGFSSSGQSDVRCDYGCSVGNGEAHGSLGVQTYGSTRDSLTFTAPGVPVGTPGTVEFTVTISGSLSAPTGSSGATWAYTGDLGGGVSDIGRTGTLYSPSIHNPQYVGDPLSTFTAVGSFQFGMPAPLSIELHCTAGASYDSNGAGNASFQNMKLIWNGLANVTAGGNPVNTWSVSSQSGTDWRNQINPPVTCAADIGAQGGVPGNDGVLDNNDFVVFIDYFFNHNPAADVGTQGGVPGHDNLWDNNDFVVFIDLFFAGC